MASNTNPALQNRPYRSHRVPACTRCRSRKIRCHIDIPGEPCLSCRERRLKCQYIDTPIASTPTEEDGRPSVFKRPRLNGNGSSTRAHSAPVLHKPSNNPSASIMLAPHIAEDIDILERHISQHRTVDGEARQNYQTLSHDTRNPIVYQSVPRYRIGLAPELGCGKVQLEIITQIMGPFKQEVIDLYFSHIHYHFPILDDETCDLVRNGPLDKISKNLLCVIYAIGAPHWRKSETLKMHPRPDLHFVWNKAISAVLEDFLSPSIATVVASALDQIGRPSVFIVGNITLCGRNVALAQTFGLHRNPLNWEISGDEKSVRVRAWWGVLITDYWASIAYGAPPRIVKGFYDVPLPTLDMLIAPKATVMQKYASTCFIHLCALTELLGDILPLVHHIGPDPDEFSNAATRQKAVLDDLESKLPEWLPLPNRTGTSNLWFCFLSMRLLISRVALRAAVLLGDSKLEKTRLDELRVASSTVLDFVLSLEESQFQDFWLPYATYLLVLAVQVSLRCTVEAQDVETRNSSITRLERVMTHIQHAHDNYDWDIAGYCLERCSDTISKVAAFAAQASQLAPEAIEIPRVSLRAEDYTAGTVLDDSSSLLSDILDPNAFDFSWEGLWDTPTGMPNFTI
jgi:hypothetical protein